MKNQFFSEVSFVPKTLKHSHCLSIYNVSLMYNIVQQKVGKWEVVPFLPCMGSEFPMLYKQGNYQQAFSYSFILSRGLHLPRDL